MVHGPHVSSSRLTLHVRQEGGGVWREDGFPGARVVLHWVKPPPAVSPCSMGAGCSTCQPVPCHCTCSFAAAIWEANQWTGALSNSAFQINESTLSNHRHSGSAVGGQRGCLVSVLGPSSFSRSSRRVSWVRVPRPDTPNSELSSSLLLLFAPCTPLPVCSGLRASPHSRHLLS